MELIDILWRQDIDLGAGREVFDYSHRQKEDALRRQRELEEEERQRHLREQEKALLAELQLDEETGEFVPRAMPISQPGAATTATPPEASQTDIFTEQDVDTLSFDECLQLLEESFPLVEPIETTSPALDPSLTPASARAPGMMGPQQPALLPAAPSTQKSQSDLEQAWMELLSIPELQCLNMQIGEVLEPAAYPSTIVPTSMEDPNYSFYMPKITDVVPAPAEAARSPGYQNTFEGTFSTVIPPDSLSQVTVDSSGLSSGFNIDSFCDMFYPEVSGASVSDSSPLTGSESVGSPVGHVPDEPPVKPMEVAEFALGEGFEGRKPEVTTEFPDSDSGLSLDSSPNNSSPAKSAFGDGSFGYSDSDTDKMDSSPGSVHSDYAETFSSSFGTDGLLENCDSPASQSGASQEPDVRHPKTEPTAGTGHSRPPFTKDKHRRRAESRLSRDEQRAKALRIPFTVELIINLPVDDFNEMMSKQQLSEAQLALVRDIRRRGKNKVAAQNCRKRKMESIAGLEQELDSLREDKERLLREHSENDSSLRQAKQQLSTLYQEVFSMLRDEHGRPYSPSEYSLQQTSDGNIYLVPRTKKAPSNSALGN